MSMLVRCRPRICPVMVRMAMRGLPGMAVHLAVHAGQPRAIVSVRLRGHRCPSAVLRARKPVRPTYASTPVITTPTIPASTPASVSFAMPGTT